MQAATIRVRGESDPDELATIAQRAQAFTNASGSAIALSEGSGDEIVCRARAGSTAPEVGTSLRVESTFTGLCVQSGKELRCDDAETDSRVDKEAIRALGIRSMVVVPIKAEGLVLGVLAAFAPTARAFNITHVAVLKSMADQVAAYLEHKQRDEAYAPEPLPAPAVKAVSPSAEASAPVPPALVITPAAPASTPPEVPDVPKVEGVPASALAEDIDRNPQTTPVLSGLGPDAAPVSEKQKTNSPDQEKEWISNFRASFRTMDAVEAPEKWHNPKLLAIGAAAVVVVIALVVVLMFGLRRPAAAPQPTLGTASSPGTATGLAPGHGNVQPAANNNSTATRAKQQEFQPKREQAIVLPAHPSRISTARDNSAPASEAPALALGSVPVSGSLSNLASPTSASTPSRIWTKSDLEPVTVIKKVPPVYPMVARQRRLSGSVVVEGTVDKNGRINHLQLISGPPIFRDAAFDAVKQWVFRPARLNGQAIEQPTKIRLEFGTQ